MSECEKVCKNCKFWDSPKENTQNINLGLCNLLSPQTNSFRFHSDKNFGCNQFEPRELKPGPEMDIAVAKILGYKLEVNREFALLGYNAKLEAKLYNPKGDFKLLFLPQDNLEGAGWFYVPKFSTDETAWLEIVHYFFGAGYSVHFKAYPDNFYGFGYKDIFHPEKWIEVKAATLQEAACKALIAWSESKSE